MTAKRGRNTGCAVRRNEKKVVPGILAPLYDQGYALAQREDGRVDAIYMPALSQVWLDEDAVSQSTASILLHEFHHVYLSLMQPSMLDPLVNYLLGQTSRPPPNHYADIVESLVAIIPPVHSGHKPSKRAIRATRPEYRELAEQYLAFARRLAHTSDGSERHSVSEALLAVNSVLLRIRPHIAGTAKYIMERLPRTPLPEGWVGRRDLSLELSRSLEQIRAGSAWARHRFLLAPPVDPHRYLGDMLICFSQALGLASRGDQRLIHSFPSILMVLSMTGFIVLPVIRLQQAGRNYQATITVEHSNPSAEQPLRRSIQLQATQCEAKRSCGQNCQAGILFKETLQRVLPFCRATNRDRLVSVSRAILKFLPGRIEKVLLEDSTCPACSVLLREPSVRSAARQVAGITDRQISAFLSAAQRYERWLLFDSVERFTDVRVDKVIKAYSFL